MEALLSYHRTAKHAIAGPAGDLPWNRLSFYFGHTKKKEHKKKRPFTRKLWNAVTLRFDKRQFEANFDEAFCHQSIHRCRVVIWFMLVLVVVHYILEFTFSDPPQNRFFPISYDVRKPPVWAHALILAMVLIYTGYMFMMSRSQRFFFTRAMHALMVSTIFVVGFGLLAITILTKDISPPSTFIVFFCGIYISPPSKFPIVTIMCTAILTSLLAFLLSSGMLSANEKLSHLFLLLLADFLGMVVLSQIETTLRHEFMQIHNTKVEFRDLIQEQAHWEVLISTILPIPVAKALRENVASVASRYRDVTILFAEIVDFESQIGIKLSPDETVIFLNRIFMIFDRLIDKHKLEKVKTIGPTIVIAGGLNVPMEDHLTEMVELAIDMMLEMERLNKRIPMKVNLRIGLNSGELVAGVIGKTRLCYDVWGDTVNTASRMMTHSVAGKIHVPFSLCGRIYTQYVIEDRGEIEVKGKGRMRTAYVVQRRATNNTALSLHFLPPLFTTIERKFKHLSMGAEIQTKDQAPEDPFRRSNPGLAVLPAPPRSPPAMLLRKPAANATVVQSDSPGRRHHIKVSPAQPAQYNRTTWQEQLDHLLSTNIAGAANANNSNDSSVVVDRDFFSKWTLRYHHAPLESQFHQYRSVVNSRDFSFTVFAGLVLNCAFGLIDYLIAPRTLFLRHLIVPRFAVVVPAFVIAMFVAQVGKARLGRGMHWMGVFLAAASAAAVLANTVLALDHALYRAYFIAEYAIVIMYAFLFVHVRFLYFVSLYIVLVLGYAIVVIVVGGEMVGTLRWGLFLFLALGGVATVSSYQTEQLIRTEWILVSMGERSKRKREKQKETVEDLLSNILPKKVVMRLKSGYVGTFAEDFQNCTVMFIDVCDFCDICNTLTPSELVDTLDAIFSGFDTILAQYPTLEKVKTIGDCYMVVGGALDKSPDHAQQIVNCGLDMIRMMKGMSIKQNGVLKPLSIRIGVHSGLVHAGLIGWTKMIYDMWGETVDIAKMCESQGIPDYVQITHATFNQIRNFDFRSEPSTPIVVRPDKKIDTIIISAKNFRKDMDNYV